jgi:hypothetical protein
MGLAYRFVPLDVNGAPTEGARYTLIRDQRLSVGERLRVELEQASVWEIVEIRSGTGSMLGAFAPDGTEIPLAGTVFCEAVEVDRSDGAV